MDNLTCLRCGETGGLTLELSEGDRIECSECDGDYTTDDAAEMVGAWVRLLAWVALHPAKTPAEGAVRQ